MFRTTKQFPIMHRRYFPGTIAIRLALVIITLASSANGWTGAIQYNIGNAAGLHGEEDIVSLIVYKGKRPLVITLNEVCGTRYWRLAVAIRSFGYKGYFDATNPSGCGGSNGGLGYGNAIFYLGEGVQAFASPYVNNDCDNRRAVCVKVRLGQFAYLACTTHLENDNPSRAERQSVEFFHWVNRKRQETGNLPTIVSGDFNLKPNQKVKDPKGKDWVPMDLWYAYYKEVDGSPHNARATHSNGKIDYIFYTPGFTLQRDADVEPGLSDHHMLIGYFIKR
jgi:hypothetical protein